MAVSRLSGTHWMLWSYAIHAIRHAAALRAIGEVLANIIAPSPAGFASRGVGFWVSDRLRRVQLRAVPEETAL